MLLLRISWLVHFLVKIAVIRDLLRLGKGVSGSLSVATVRVGWTPLSYNGLDRRSAKA